MLGIIIKKLDGSSSMLSDDLSRIVLAIVAEDYNPEFILRIVKLPAGVDGIANHLRFVSCPDNDGEIMIFLGFLVLSRLKKKKKTKEELKEKGKDNKGKPNDIDPEKNRVQNIHA